MSSPKPKPTQAEIRARVLESLALLDFASEVDLHIHTGNGVVRIVVIGKERKPDLH